VAAVPFQFVSGSHRGPFGNAPLVVSQTLVDPDTGMSMTTDWVSGSGAAITVSFGAGGPAAVTVATDRQLHAEPVGLGQG
jgi:hypothetical protein